MSKITLVIIYNHNYEANIDRLEKIYADRFHKIYHIIPFYRGNRANVIKVYGTSYLFHDYIRQAIESFKDEESSHYCFVADDIFLNPQITENNILEKLHLNNEAAFISHLHPLSLDSIPSWPWTVSVYQSLLNNPSCLYKGFLPSMNKAQACFKKHNIQLPKMTNETYGYLKNFFKINHNNYFSTRFAPSLSDILRIKDYKMIFKSLYKSSKILIQNCVTALTDKNTSFFTACTKLIKGQKEQFVSELNKEILQTAHSYLNKGNSVYPLARAYSDFIIIPQQNITSFADKLGIFASMNIFVEVAIPTAMLLNVDKIVTLADTSMKLHLFWGTDRQTFEQNHDLSLKKLSNYCNENDLCFHPVKFSKWSD